MYAAMMMASENRMGRWTASPAARTDSVRSSLAPVAPLSSRVRTIRSTITIVASTRIPKSSAPMLSRLRVTPEAYMQMKANRSESGMMMAVSSAARRLTRKKRSTATTITKPSIRTREIVWSVLSTSSVRSWKGTIRTPWGSRVLLSSSTASWIPFSTSLAFSHRSRSTIPSTPPAPSGS